MMTLSMTDLPVPEGPMMAVVFRRGTSKVTSRRTVWLPKDLVTPRMAMTASGDGPDRSTGSSRVAGPDRVCARLHSDMNGSAASTEERLGQVADRAGDL